MSHFVYHFKQKGMTGNTLIPLNEMKAEIPHVYEEQVKKYKGREFMLENRIPILDCFWNDVLHMSPINPQTIIDLWRKEGLYEYAGGPQQIECYKIPVQILNEQQTVPAKN